MGVGVVVASVAVAGRVGAGKWKKKEAVSALAWVGNSMVFSFCACRGCLSLLFVDRVFADGSAAEAPSQA